jgi:hypothetical protein
VRWFSHRRFMRMGIYIQGWLSLLWTHSVRVYPRCELVCCSSLFGLIYSGLCVKYTLLC